MPRTHAASQQLTRAAHAHFVALCVPFADYTTEFLPQDPHESSASFPVPNNAPSDSAHGVLDPVSGAALSCLREGFMGPEWLQSAANEIGRLAEGVLPHMPHSTDTIHFIRHDMPPPSRKATYLRIVAEPRPLKVETKCIPFTAGGDNIEYPDTMSTRPPQI